MRDLVKEISILVKEKRNYWEEIHNLHREKRVLYMEIQCWVEEILNCVSESQY